MTRTLGYKKGKEVHNEINADSIREFSNSLKNYCKIIFLQMKK